MDIVPIGKKVCIDCEEPKLLTEFKQRCGRPIGQTDSRCDVCRKAYQVKATLNWRSKNPGKSEKINRDWISRNRRLALEHYSGGVPKCACCGEQEYVFLALDHINDDGNVERAQKSWSRAGFWSKLVKTGFPEGYQVLCHNCNFAKTLGVCPHKETKDN